MKNPFWFIGCCCLSFFMNGQNIPSPTLYLADNQYLISPAWAGIGDSYKIRMLGQWQWLDVQDAPRTYYVSVNGRLSGKTGFGVLLSDDENGFTSIRSATFSLAYHLILDADKYRFLSFGMSYRFSNFNVDTSSFSGGQPDPAIGGDRSLDESNFDFGLLYRANGFFLNLSFIDIINRSEADFTAREPLSISKVNVYASYEFDLASTRTGYLVAEPSVNYHYFSADGRSETDFNLKITQEERDFSYWGGLTFRVETDESNPQLLSLTPMMGLKYRNFTFGYGYQTFFTETSAFNNNTHLLSLGYDFGGAESNCICTQIRGIK